MKKYRLIKELPFENSPKIGYISEPKLVGHENLHYWNCNWFNPKDYPEFWEEVVEKEYEIVEYTTKNPDIILNVGCYQKPLIKSVKRLSDGEVFSIGDKVKYSGKKCMYSHFTIDNFYITTDNRMLARSLDCIINEYITEIVKEPIFTTEDGVDIYQGMSYWCVNTSSHLWTLWLQTAREKTQLHKNVLAFATEKAAQNYIKYNKPVLSYNDVAEIVSDVMGKDYYIILCKNKFEQLVESKL